MYISDTEMNARSAAKTAFVYLLLSLFLVLFGAIYEIYSHEVYSFYMLYAFVFPLAGGVLPFSIIHLRRHNWYPNIWTRRLYHSGIATLSVGSIIQGVLEIYGTTNAMTQWYWIIGAGFVALSIISFCTERRIHETE